MYPPGTQVLIHVAHGGRGQCARECSLMPCCSHATVSQHSQLWPATTKGAHRSQETHFTRDTVTTLCVEIIRNITNDVLLTLIWSLLSVTPINTARSSLSTARRFCFAVTPAAREDAGKETRLVIRLWAGMRPVREALQDRRTQTWIPQGLGRFIHHRYRTHRRLASGCVASAGVHSR